MRKIFGCIILIIIFTFCLWDMAIADELPEVKAQMKKIQEENARLQEQLNRQREITENLIKKIDALESKDEVLTKEVKILKEKPKEVGVEKAGLTGLIDIPELNLKGFSDMGFTTKISGDDTDSTFALGAVDFFITSKIADRVSFLTEMEFHPNPDSNSPHFHIERANIKYSISDLLNIKIGRIHTPFGYWNTAFHHGTWLQTTILRPNIYLFEADDGGFIPIHSVGIELLGKKEFDKFDLEYNFDVLNGRGRTITEIQNFEDKNDSKAINALLSIKPHFAEGLKLGANIYYDVIPSDPNTLARMAQIKELILGGHLVYIHDKVEFSSELFNVYHDDKKSGEAFNHLGFYVQGGYKIDKFTPYYRLDFLDFENGDPYFSSIDIDIMKHTSGLRWDIFNWNAIKFEYSFSDKKEGGDEHSLAVNTSFAF